MPTKTAQLPLSHAIQDYVKVIYELTTSGKPAATNAIADRLGVSAASVTGMVQRLAACKPPLITYERHRGVRLTNTGRRAALEVIRHHRLLETWLVRALGYSWENVHTEAEKLEHAMSEELEARIADALGNPSRDPHGEPIPSADLVMPADESLALTEVLAGQSAIVRRVEAHVEGALQELDVLGLRIGAVIRVVQNTPYEGLITLRIRGRRQNVTIGPSLGRTVFVERV